MEATRLIDPGFWASREPCFPGAENPGFEDAAGLVWFRTSGTTGAPRWIGHRREALLLSAAVVNRHLAVRDDQVWGLALPLHHVGGFGVVARAFESGARLAVFAGKWEPASFVEWLQVEEVAHLSLVPTQVHDLVAGKHRAPASLRTVVVGGGVLREEEGRAARALGWPVLPSYGMTEAGSQVATPGVKVLDAPYVRYPLPPLPHWTVRTDEAGRISLRGPSLFAAEMVPAEDGWRREDRVEEWFETGDRGEIGAEGLRLLGRADALVKVLGELVDPLEIERDLDFPEGVVIALPDARRDHRLVLVVEQADEWAERAVVRHNERAVGFRRIDEVVVASIPRSSLGKVRRAELAEKLRVD